MDSIVQVSLMILEKMIMNVLKFLMEQNVCVLASLKKNVVQNLVTIVTLKKTIVHSLTRKSVNVWGYQKNNVVLNMDSIVQVSLMILEKMIMNVLKFLMEQNVSVLASLRVNVVHNKGLIVLQ
jgi:hypothetical protein